MIKSFFYPGFRGNVLAGELEIAAMKVMLVGDGFKANKQDLTTRDISGEISGPGYEAGGQPLLNQRIKDGVFTADPSVWEKASITASGAVIYKQAGSLLVCYVGFDESVTSINGEFRVNWGNNEIIRVSIPSQ